MKKADKQWSKQELKVYILLLCAKADGIEVPEEIDLIKSKTSPEIFKKIYAEFAIDSEEENLEKIKDSIGRLYYSETELIELKNEIQEVFYADKYFSRKEINFNRILNKIIY